MAKIIVDHRERYSGIIKEFAKRKMDVEVKQLESADFILETKDMDGGIVTVGIEKKTQNDFINSIIDRRIIQQLMNLKEHFTKPLLVIEGEENIYTLRNFHPNAIRGMLATIAIDFQVPIIYTKNFRDTASLIEVISKRLDQPKRHVSFLPKRVLPTLREQQEYVIQSIPTVGPTLARALLKKFKSVQGIVNANKEDLQKVDKIGKKKASTIIETLTKKYDEETK